MGLADSFTLIPAGASRSLHLIRGSRGGVLLGHLLLLLELGGGVLLGHLLLLVSQLLLSVRLRMERGLSELGLGVLLLSHVLPFGSISI
jgi:hypothetical protein